MKPNTLRQPSSTWIQPPITGASAGAMPKIIVIGAHQPLRLRPFVQIAHDRAAHGHADARAHALQRAEHEQRMRSSERTRTRRTPTA